jgi:putative tricarboxylic transport membrane protein
VLSNLVNGLTALANPEAAGLLVLGMLVGMFIGMLPGLGVVLILTLMLPFVYHLGVVPAIALMLATQAGSYFSASITAILINTPGSPESFPTTLDGFPMAERGEAGRALAISATSTWLGAWVACAAMIGLVQIAPQLNSIFKPPEFVAIIVLALILIASVGGAVMSKVILSGAIGFMLSFVGSDPVTGIDRFTFGAVNLFNGISVIPFALGVFAVTQMVVMYGRRSSVARVDGRQLASQFRRQLPVGIRDTLRRWPMLLRSGLIAVVLGLIPGLGGFTANFIAYGVGRRLSKNPDSFGTGVPEGVIAAEGSSLAKEVGSLVPAIALGLPSGLGMVIFLAALTILGIQPGSVLLHTQPTLAYSMMWVMAITAFLSCLLGLLLAPWLSRVTSVRGPVLFAFIVPLAVLGSYAGVVSMTGIVELIIFSIVGLVMRKLNYSVAAIAIGLVLGGDFDDNVHISQQLYGWSVFAHSPIADAFILISVYLLVAGALRGRRQRRAAVTGLELPAPALAARHDRTSEKHPILEPIADAAIVAFSSGYLAIALGYPPAAGLLPEIVAIVALAASLVRLVGDLRGLKVARGPVAPEPSPVLQPALVASPGLGASAVEGDPSERVSEAAENVFTPRIETEPSPSPREHGWREVAAIGWVAFYALCLYLFGFRYGLSAASLVYGAFGLTFANRIHKLAFAVVVAALVYGAATGFVDVFHFTQTGVI